MSYILDALNKSEQERAKKRTPGLRDLSQDAPAKSLTIGQIMAALIVLIVANSIGVYWYFGGATNQASDREDNTKDYLEQTSQPVNPESKQNPTPEQTFTRTLEGPAPVNGSPLPESTVTITPDSLKKPIATATKRPDVEFTAHIFADDPELRMIKIDGVARHEKDQLPGGILVQEITELGVILEKNGQRFEFNVVEGWQL
ncbi:MAG: general secretion pathway protein B [Candidatus Azotimanducaceae bacterium]|jgi:general secretion pathway protein B